MKKIKIGYFIDTYFPMIDGVVMVVDNYARRLSEFAEVTVFAPCNGDYDFSDFPYKVELCKSMSIYNCDYNLPLPKLDSEFLEKLDESKLDIVHIHSHYAIGKLGLKYAKQNNIPSIITLHSQYKQNYQKVLKSKLLIDLAMDKTIKLYEKTDEVWAVNKGMADLYVSEYGGYKKPTVMLNATEINPCINIQEVRKEVNNKYNLNDDDKVLLFVGRIDVIKNILLIVDAIKIVKDANKFTFKMLFVGSGADEKKLLDRIDDNKLKDNVIMCGKITDRNMLAKIYSRADLFVFPSIYDANSLVQIEAASQKTPSLFIKDSITGSTVTDGINGFKCENNKESLSAKIIDIFKDNKLLEKVSNAAYQDLYHSWDDVTEYVLDSYKKLINASVSKR